MVHISLPRVIPHLGSKNKDKDKDTATNSNGNGDGKPSPPGLGSTPSTVTLPDQKPLILKVYVIKVDTTGGLNQDHIAKYLPGTEPRCKG